MSGHEAESEREDFDRVRRPTISESRRSSTSASQHRFRQFGPRLPCGRCFDILDPLDPDALYDGFVACTACNRPYHRRCFGEGCRRPGCPCVDSHPIDVAPPLDPSEPERQAADSIGPCNRLSDRPIGMSRGLVFLYGSDAVDLIVANNSANAVGIAPQIFPPWVDVRLDCVRARLSRRLSRLLFRDADPAASAAEPRPGDLSLAPGAQFRFTLTLRIFAPPTVEAFVPIGAAQGVLIVGQGSQRLWAGAILVVFSSSVVAATLAARVVAEGAAQTSLIALGSSFACWGTCLVLMPTALSTTLRSVVVGGYAPVGDALPAMPTAQTVIVAALAFFAFGLAFGLFFHILNDTSDGEGSGILFRFVAWTVSMFLFVGYTAFEFRPYRKTIEIAPILRLVRKARSFLRSRRT